MKYDLIINGTIVIPDQTYRDGGTDVGAEVILGDIERRMRDGSRGNESSYRHIGEPGTRTVLIRWDRVTTAEVRKHEET